MEENKFGMLESASDQQPQNIEYERLSEGFTEKVFSELELEGDGDIWIQLLKLSDDNWNEPEQEVFDELVVTEELSIDSEKVTEILSVMETPLLFSVG